MLVVEDNEEVGEFAGQVLEELGYEVRHAKDAVEALSLREENVGFDVVFTDVVMPGMSGLEFARELRERWPSLPVILTSGYSQVFTSERGPGFPLLHKPYSLEALHRAIAEALER